MNNISYQKRVDMANWLIPFLAVFTLALAGVAAITPLNARRFPLLETETLSGLPFCLAVLTGLMLFGSQVDRQAGLWLAMALGLLILACNLVNRTGMETIIENTRKIAILAVMLMAIFYLLIPPDLVSNASLLPVWMLMCVLLPLPFCINRSAKLMQTTAPINVGYLFCLMILGMVCLRTHPDFHRVEAPATLASIDNVAALSLSALLGYRIYLILISVKAQCVRFASNGNLALGLILGWAALLMTSGTARPAVTVVSLALILSPPVYASGAYMVFKYLRPFSGPRIDASWISKHFWFNVATAIILIGCGLLMTFSGFHWAIGLVAYVVGFFVYLKMLTVLEERNKQDTNLRAPHAESSL